MSPTKIIRYNKGTNSLQFTFSRGFKEKTFKFNASTIQYLIKIWRLHPHHEIIEEDCFINHQIRTIDRKRTTLPILDNEGLPFYTILSLQGDEHNFLISKPINLENPVFSTDEFNIFCVWIDHLVIPLCEEKFSYIHFSENEWGEMRSLNKGQ